MEIQPPIHGLHEGFSSEKQPPTTSPHLKNVHVFDTLEGRFRLGPRPGIKKAFETQVGGTHPVLFITSVATTYITPD